MLLARMEPWTWWIGIIFTVATVGTVVALGAQYLQKVVRPQYPSRRQRPNG
jgi:hypothetical protein